MVYLYKTGQLPNFQPSSEPINLSWYCFEQLSESSTLSRRTRNCLFIFMLFSVLFFIKTEAFFWSWLSYIPQQYDLLMLRYEVAF